MLRTVWKNLDLTRYLSRFLLPINMLPIESFIRSTWKIVWLCIPFNFFLSIKCIFWNHRFVEVNLFYVLWNWTWTLWDTNEFSFSNRLCDIGVEFLYVENAIKSTKKTNMLELINIVSKLVQWKINTQKSMCFYHYSLIFPNKNKKKH